MYKLEPICYIKIDYCTVTKRILVQSYAQYHFHDDSAHYHCMPCLYNYKMALTFINFQKPDNVKLSKSTFISNFGK